MRKFQTSSLFVLLTVLPAVAFTQATSSSGVLDDIVVTAQRREQSLQEVPISVTAFTGAQLDQQNIRDAGTPDVANHPDQHQSESDHSCAG